MIAAALAIVAIRGLVFVAYEQAHFDSDQAIVGLMAWHLAHLKALPLYVYGQTYLLALESWMAAPVLLLAGPSVTALKAPMLALNLAIAAFLIRLLVRDGRISPAGAFVAALFFIAPPPIAASRLVEAAGGNIGPFACVLVLWLLRNRPLLFGVVLGLGVLNRPFALYGAVGILIVELVQGTLQTRDGLRRVALAAVAFVTVLTVVHALTPFASNYYDAVKPPSLASTTVASALDRLRELTLVVLPILFGARADSLQRFNVSSGLTVGHAWVAPLLGVIGLTILARIMYLRRASSVAIAPESGGRFPVYLMVVGLQSAAAYLLLPPGGDDMQVRYVLLALLFPTGLVGSYLALEPRLALQAGVVVSVIGWASANLLDHARLIHEYQTRRPPDTYRELATYLNESAIRFGRAPYWTAYHVTFLSGERVIVDPTDVVRIPAYHDIVEEHRAEAVTIGSGQAPCANPIEIRHWHICRPSER